jgi:3-hydroxymyristoyl/3-hydroxydecanoyl-(acyl carrier protein) dehydratase
MGERLTVAMYERADLGEMYLPAGQMLQIDRVAAVDAQHIVCEMDIGPDHWVFPLHFPEDPIYPGCLQIEAAGQVVAIWAWHNGLKGKPRLARVSAEFDQPIVPQPGPLIFSGTVKRRRHICLASVELSAAGQRVAAVEIALVIVPDCSEAGAET